MGCGGWSDNQPFFGDEVRWAACQQHQLSNTPNSKAAAGSLQMLLF